MNGFTRLLSLLSLTFSLAACGGGTNPPAPSASPLNDDSGATDIVLSDIVLDQIFQTASLNYTATVPLMDSTTTVTASLSDANASLTVNGMALGTGEESEQITLNKGSSNIITVVVTAEDSVNTTTYTIEVTRQSLANFAQQAYIKASNTDGGDQFGSIALNGDTLAVGARLEDSSATGIDGDQADNSADHSGAVYVFTRDPSDVWSQQAYIKASNTDRGDQFGLSIALNGDTLAVGAYSEDSSATGVDGDQADNSADSSGAVYVFARDASDVWTQQAYIKASNTDSSDGFGGVSLDGDTLAVGAQLEDSSATGIDGDQADNSVEDAGAVYVFTRDASGVWSQQAYIKASNAEADDRFGRVALDGDTLAVSAWAEDSSATGIDGDQSDNSLARSGAVYVFTRDASSVWSQQAYFKASNTDIYDFFGTDLALDGDTLAVGAHGEDSSATGVDGDQADNSAELAGAVYMFTRDASDVWSQQAYIKASNTDAIGPCSDWPDPPEDYCPGQDYFARVALDGDTLAVGASGEDSSATGIEGDQANGAIQAGAAYVFE